MTLCQFVLDYEEDLLQHLHVLTNLDAILLTCSVYELLSSFELEVKFVWQGPPNANQICYILARYTCLVSFTVFLISDLSFSRNLTWACNIEHNPSGKKYNNIVEGFIKLQEVTNWLMNINLVPVEIIFSLRTWALWERSRRVGIWLILLIVLLWGSAFENLIVHLCTASPHPPSGSMLIFDSRPTIIPYVYFVFMTIFYFIIMFLVAVQTYRARHQLNISLIRLVHAQGLMYYTLRFSIVSVLSILVFRSEFYDLRVFFVARILQFVSPHLACRMSLSLRAQSRRTVVDLNSGVLDTNNQHNTVPLSELNFRHMTTQQEDAEA